jgi:hypothetical protein
MRILTLAMVGLTALAGAAASAPETSLVWATAPSFDDMAAAWPTGIGDLQEGRAVLQCRIASGGRLSNCDIVDQQPVGQGFARAARTLVGRFRLKVDYRTLSQDRDHFVFIPFHFVNPATAEGRMRRVASPRWISMPDPDRIQGVFPKAAADAGVARGVGVIDCRVAVDGRLTDCKVAREAPAGLGFGEAAMLVAPIMQMNPWTDDGRPVDGARVKLPVQFGLAP